MEYKLTPTPPPQSFLGFSLCMCLSLCLHMKVIDLGLYDLFIDTKTALRSGEKERANQPSTHNNSLSSALHFLSLSPRLHLLLFLLFFLTFSLTKLWSPPPTWAYINVTNHISANPVKHRTTFSNDWSVGWGPVITRRKDRNATSPT